MMSVINNYRDLYTDLYNEGIENLDRSEVIELLKIDAIYHLAEVIRNHSTNNKEDK